MAEILTRSHYRATTKYLVLREPRLQPHRVGDRHRSTYLAGTPPPATRGSVAASAHPAQLPLHRVGIPRPGRRFTRSAARLRAFCGLWGHYCSDTRVVFNAVAVRSGWHWHRLDL